MTRYSRVWKVDGNQQLRRWIAAILRRWRKERRAARAAVCGSESGAAE